MKWFQKNSIIVIKLNYSNLEQKIFHFDQSSHIWNVQIAKKIWSTQSQLNWTIRKVSTDVCRVHAEKFHKGVFFRQAERGGTLKYIIYPHRPFFARAHVKFTKENFKFKRKCWNAMTLDKKWGDALQAIYAKWNVKKVEFS